MPIPVDEALTPKVSQTPVGPPKGGLSVDAVEKALKPQPEPKFGEGQEDWFMRSAKTLMSTAMSGVKNPKAVVKGSVKAAASGAVDMGGLAVSGVSGLATAMVGKGFESGKEVGEQAAAKAKELTQAITGLNLAPQGKYEEAAGRLLNILPDGIQAAGDTVFEKTGSAIAGAGAQALLTLLTMKPEVAGKTLRVVKSPKGQLSAADAAAKAKIQASYDELAKTNPEGAKAIVEHVSAADEKLGKALDSRAEAAKVMDEGVIGQRSVEARKAESAVKFEQVEGTTPPPQNGMVRYYHGGSPEKVTGPLWFTSHLPDAKGWAGRSPGMKVWYVDVPEADPVRRGEPEYGVLPPSRVELPAKYANQRKVLQDKPKVRIMTSDEIGAGMRDTMREGYEVMRATRGKAGPEIEAFELRANAIVPGGEIVNAKLKEYFDQAVRTFNPEALGPEAKAAGAVLAKRIAEQMRKESVYVHQSAERRGMWNRQTPEAQMEFIDHFEQGGWRFKDPKAQAAAEGYRRWNEEIYKQDQALGLEYEAEDNYLYHTFKDSKGAAEYLASRFGPKWNNPGFIKQRGFQMYSAAREAGFEPRFTNPEEIMLARQHASDVAQMRTEVLRDLKEYGLAKEITKEDPERPEDFRSTEWRAPTGERYWVHNSASAVLHNAFNTKSLWTMEGAGGDLFRGAMYLKNAYVPVKLSMSLFHPIHVQTIDNVTGMVRASKELLSGKENPVGWAARMAKSAAYMDSISNATTGYRVLKAYQGRLKGEPTANDMLALQYMADGGFIPEMSSQYRIGAMQKFSDALAQRRATALWHAPFAAIEAIQKPMFQLWIPSLKIASYLKDVQTAIKVDPSLISDPLKRQMAFRRIAKSVDNRYGEMAYNTLFWNRWVKDLAVANTLSLGWQLGFIREYGGGLLDIGQAATTKGGIAAKAKTGLLDRPMFVMFYTTQALAYGGLLTWAMTGKPPEKLLDYVYPKTGEQTSDGKDARVNTMFYAREFAAITKHIQNEGLVKGVGQTIEAKGSGLMGMAYEWGTGVNAFGQEISDPNAPAYIQLQQRLLATLKDMEPMSVEASGQQSTLKGKAMAYAGLTPAPKFVTDTQTEAAIKGLYDKYYAPKQTSFEKAEMSKDRKELKRLYDVGNMDEYGDLLDKMRKDYDLTPKDVFKLVAGVRKGKDPMISMFKQLDWQQQKRLLDGMTQEERDKYLPHSNKEHLRRRYEPPEDEGK